MSALVEDLQRQLDRAKKALEEIATVEKSDEWDPVHTVIAAKALKDIWGEEPGHDTIAG